MPPTASSHLLLRRVPGGTMGFDDLKLALGIGIFTYIPVVFFEGAVCPRSAAREVIVIWIESDEIDGVFATHEQLFQKCLVVRRW